MRDEVERGLAGLLGDVETEGFVARDLHGPRLQERELGVLEASVAGLETPRIDLGR